MKNSNSRRIAPTRSPFRVIYSAFHEAGHAIAALVLGIRIVRVTVTSSRDAVGSCEVILPDRHVYGGQRQQRAMARACVVMTYAGLVGENMVNPSLRREAAWDEVRAHELALAYEIYGEPVGPDNEDSYLVLMDDLQRQAELLIARHRQGVALLAAELLRLESISGTELEAWARRNYPPATRASPVDRRRVSAAINKSRPTPT